MGKQMQIGEVADRTGLSLRTIRYYEEVELVVPSARSQGGFRLYTDPDVHRLLLIKQMKPLGFQLDEMRELLPILDPEERRDIGHDDEAVDRLHRLAESAQQRCEELRAQLHTAEQLTTTLQEHLESAVRPASTQGS